MSGPHARTVARAIAGTVAGAGSRVVAAPAALHGGDELSGVEEGQSLATGYHRCGHDSHAGFDDRPDGCWDNIDCESQLDDKLSKCDLQELTSGIIERIK